MPRAGSDSRMQMRSATCIHLTRRLSDAFSRCAGGPGNRGGSSHGRTTVLWLSACQSKWKKRRVNTGDTRARASRRVRQTRCWLAEPPQMPWRPSARFARGLQAWREFHPSTCTCLAPAWRPSTPCTALPTVSVPAARACKSDSPTSIRSRSSRTWARVCIFLRGQPAGTRSARATAASGACVGNLL